MMLAGTLYDASVVWVRGGKVTLLNRPSSDRLARVEAHLRAMAERVEALESSQAAHDLEKAEAEAKSAPDLCTGCGEPWGNGKPHISTCYVTLRRRRQ
jgi:hypothetical protein